MSNAWWLDAEHHRVLRDAPYHPPQDYDPEDLAPAALTRASLPVNVFPSCDFQSPSSKPTPSNDSASES